jgi:hypothetical protein
LLTQLCKKFPDFFEYETKQNRSVHGTTHFV